VRKNDGILGRDGVQLLAIRESFFAPKRVVPTAASDPFACFMTGNGIGNTLLHFFRRRHSGQRHGEQVRGGAAKMHVSVVEAGHQKLATELNRFCALLAAAAIEQYMVHFSDTADPSFSDGHGFGPRKRRIVGVDAPVYVIDRVRGTLLRAKFQLKDRNNCGGGKCDDSHQGGNMIRLCLQRDFSSAIPEIPSTVRSARFKPRSRPAESYHSCNE
jgi:hypothetical protein